MKEENITFFANELLARLEKESPLVIAYESQVCSAAVGFDFATPQLAFDRLKEEMYELEEALVKYENKKDTRQHLCDEAMDIVFGVINVLRHSSVDMDIILSKVSSNNLALENCHLRKKFDEIYNNFNAFEIVFKTFDATDISASNMTDAAIVLINICMDFIIANEMNPDEIMRKNVEKYLLRCQFIEIELKKENKEWSDIDLDEIYSHWRQSKEADI